MSVLNKSERKKITGEGCYKTPTHCVNLQGNTTAFLIFSHNIKMFLAVQRDAEWFQ